MNPSQFQLKLANGFVLEASDERELYHITEQLLSERYAFEDRINEFLDTYTTGFHSYEKISAAIKNLLIDGLGIGDLIGTIEEAPDEILRQQNENLGRTQSK